jgi:xanthine dehydrogenase iron-sulfur cluster and FAD-binding subunit A
MWHTYFAPSSVAEALELLEQYGDRCCIIAGGTDLILELERGVRKQQIIVDVSRIAGLDRIAASGASESAGHATQLALGSLVTHNQVVASRDAVTHAFPLARACWLVGAPQIRNRGTVAGNLVTASPANDTIAPLWAMDATVTLASRARGERTLPFDRFFLGVRRTALRSDEMLVRINVPVLKPTESGTFLKLGLRQAQAISVVNVAAIVDFGLSIADSGSETGATLPIRNPQSIIRNARIALGSVAPTIVRATEAEAYLAGRELAGEVIEHAAEMAAAAARPISDVRGSADYRRDMVRVLVARALRQLRDGTERADWPEQPVLLQGRSEKTIKRSGGEVVERTVLPGHPVIQAPDHISLTVNGRPIALSQIRGKTLLRALREDAGLTGTKEGCAEGECGACTVWLDGVAVMSCLVPAERADGCSVVTIEGLADLSPGPCLHRRGEAEERLHPLQQAFVDAGAVQCGYCTPGVLMSAANLLEEFPRPTNEQVRQALTGNLCRCTGYYKILEAIERASIAEVQP